jgi:hypothetical protein
MNVLELKGSIVNMVALLESPKELTRLRALINDFVKSPDEFEAYDDTYTLTPQQEAELDEAIQQTYDPTQLVPHEEVIKTMRQWLKE